MIEKENVSFEEALAKLEDVVKKLEAGSLKLDEAFNAFEEGLALAKICEEKLKNVETQVSKILKDGKEEDFVVEESE